MSIASNKILAHTLTALLTCTVGGVIATAPAQAATSVSAAGELAPMLAPVALYPDALLAQVLTASQFPDQISAASRWVKANPKLSGTEAARAASRKKWNPAVQSLVQFPGVLSSMASQPAWVKSLGDTYARRPADVMASVQQLRGQAQKAGHLKTSKEQKVVVVGSTISIDPVDTHVVYVPTYDPRAVYGTWTYAAPPVTVVRDTTSSAVAGLIGFGLGVAVANTRWGDIDWGRNRTVVNNYYSDNSLYVDNGYVDNSNTVHVDNRDQSSHYSNHESYSATSNSGPVDDHGGHESYLETSNSGPVDDHGGHESYLETSNSGPAEDFGGHESYLETSNSGPAEDFGGHESYLETSNSGPAEDFGNDASHDSGDDGSWSQDDSSGEE